MAQQLTTRPQLKQQEKKQLGAPVSHLESQGFDPPRAGPSLPLLGLSFVTRAAHRIVPRTRCWCKCVVFAPGVQTS